MPSSSDRPLILVLPPILVGGSLLIGVLLHYWFWPITPLPIVLARALGLTIFVASGLLAHLAHKAMRRAGTNILPNQPALALATDGPFRFTRNPLYIAAAGVYLGAALWVDGLIPLLLLLPTVWLLHWAIILPEERYLEMKFGDTYRAYRTQVHRWL